MMHKIKGLILFLFSLLIPAYGICQKKKKEDSGSDYIAPRPLSYEDLTYDQNVKTVLFHPENRDQSPPLIKLNSTDRLHLSFDDMGAGLRSFQFKVIHCEYNWTPSVLLPAEYLDGFFDENVTIFSSSTNTIIPYTHYELFFPGENMRPTKSGNYLLLVYADFDPNKIILSRRFRIYEEKVSIAGFYTFSSDVKYRNQKQELRFTVDFSGIKSFNPVQEFTLSIYQNFRPDMAVENCKPGIIQDGKMVFDFNDAIPFVAGNEFRYFNTNHLYLKSERIAKTEVDSAGSRAWVVSEGSRKGQKYSFYRDINGRYRPDRAASRSPEIEADYVWVNFTLKHSEEIAGSNVYVGGAFNDWKCNANNKMVYDPEEGCYRARIFLKQGFYNYQYLVLKDGSKEPDPVFFEGSLSETENEYLVLVYHRPPGQPFESLVGARIINTLN
jgi:hypothetical protein